MSEPVPARELRVSDDERRHVIGLLERATGRGLIDIDEFTARVDTALAARTRGELNAVLLDLPGLTHPEGRMRASAPAVRSRAASPVAPADGAALNAVLTSVSRRGVWDVPPVLRLHVAMGSADLDFTEAAIPHDSVRIELDVTAGSVELRLPETARVRRDDLQAVLGSVSEHVRGGADGPEFVLHGTLRAGSLDVRGPRRKWFRRRA